MNWLFWSLFIPVVVILLAIFAVATWVFRYFWREVQKDAAFVPPAVKPQQVISGAEAYERTRTLLALTKSSALPTRQPLRYRVH